MQSEFEADLKSRLAQLDIASIKHEYERCDEFVVVENFLPATWLAALRDRLPDLDPRVHRNYIPKHKKGGSVSRFDLDAEAPEYAELYLAPALTEFLRQITGQELLLCPDDDPHTYALYYYTEPGDHIGYHYDTSYYRGIRFTVLFGLINDSTCELECQLYKDDTERDTETRSLQLEPGTLAIFNGDKLYHRVTPLGHDECRVVLTMEYVTSTQMHPFRRFVSNMKDSIAYFGFKQVFAHRTDR